IGHTAAMWVIVVCIALVFVGLVAVVRWGGLAVEPPPTPAQDAPGPTGTPPVSLVVRRYLWYLAVAAVSGAAAGILAAGAGGRLVMRLLAVTAGADAQGRITEAEEVVGRITVDGTLGFVVFTGLFFGTVSGAAYLLLRRWLPAGRAGQPGGATAGCPAWCHRRPCPTAAARASGTVGGPGVDHRRRGGRAGVADPLGGRRLARPPSGGGRAGRAGRRWPGGLSRLRVGPRRYLGPTVGSVHGCLTVPDGRSRDLRRGAANTPS